MNKKIFKLITIFSVIFLIAIVTAAAYKFKFDPIISESEIDVFDPVDGQYISDNFNGLVQLEMINNIQASKKCFSKNNCFDDKKDTENWCATMIYGIPETTFTQSKVFCIDVPLGSNQIDVQNALIQGSQKEFLNLKLKIPPIFIIDLTSPLINMSYDFALDQWR